VILTPIIYFWVQEIHLLLVALVIYGIFIQGIFSWASVWLPELFPTRMRATAAGFIFNAPRLISAIAPLIAGTLIVTLGGYGKAATIIGLFYILGLIAVPFLPETKGIPLSEADSLSEAHLPDTAQRA
jgi:MFS family permease